MSETILEKVQSLLADLQSMKVDEAQYTLALALIDYIYQVTGKLPAESGGRR